LFFGRLGEGFHRSCERFRCLADTDAVSERLRVRAETVDAEVDQQILGLREHDGVVQLEAASLLVAMPGRGLRAFHADEALAGQRADFIEDLVFLKNRPFDDLCDGVRRLQADEDAAFADAQLVEPVLEFIFALGGDAETGRCFHVIPLP